MGRVAGATAQLLPVGRLFGVPVAISASLPAGMLLAAFVGGSHVRRQSLFEAVDPADFATFHLPEVSTPGMGATAVGAIVVAAIVLLSVLIHELGHVAGARLARVDVALLRLDGFGAAVEVADEEETTPEQEALTVAGGPLATMALLAVALSLPAGDVAGAGDEGLAPVLALAWDAGRLALIWVNVLALAINLTPVRPLDGGHLLAAIRRWAATSR